MHDTLKATTRAPRHLRRCTVLSGSMLLLGGVASAADNSTTPAPATTPPGRPVVRLAQAGQPGHGVEDVVVTARHRSERAQTVPIGLTSVSAAKLKANAITSITNLEFVAPTLQVTEFNPRNTSFNIRGVGNNVSVSNDGLDSGVGVYVDGVYIARPGIAAFDFPDIDTVQVLRGPQGTLFGRNTTAGAIDVRTALPTFHPEAELETSVGNYGYWQVRGTASDELIPGKLAGRISFIGDQRDGTITSIVNGEHYNTLDDKAVRGQLLATPTDDLTLRFIADYAHQLQNCCVNMVDGVFTKLTNGTTIPYNFFQREAYTGYKVASLYPFNYDTNIANKTYFEMETAGASLQADYNLNGITLTSITAARLWNWWPYNGSGPGLGIPVTNFGNQNDWQRQITQEFRGTGSVGDKIDYTAGFYFFYQDLKGFLHTGYGADGGPWYFGSKYSRAVETAALSGFDVSANTDPVTNSYSGYGQATYHITPDLSFTGGLRYVYEDKSGSYNQFTEGGVPLDELPTAERAVVASLRTAVGGTRLYYNDHDHNGSVGWLTTLSYKVTPDVFAYATYSRGVKSPGINVVALPVTVNPIVKPERVDNYELGLKTSAFGNRVTANIDGFWEEDSDYQGIIAAPLNASGTTFATYASSVPKVRTRGFEFDGNARPLDWLSLNLAAAYTEGIYESFPNGQCPVEQVGAATKKCNLSGLTLPGNSKWTGAAGGEASQPIGTYFNHDSTAYFGADFSLRSAYYVAANDSVTSKVPGYGLLNVRAGVRTVDGRYDLFVWAHNATNTRYYLVRGAAGPFSGLTYGNIGDPATFGATLRVRFR